MGYLLTQMFVYMLGAFLLGLFLGWLIWGRMKAELDSIRAERDRLKDDLDNCGRARADLERRLRDAEANAVNERARLTAELDAVAKAKAEAAAPAAAPAALMAAPAAKAKASPKAKAVPAAKKAAPAPKPAKPAKPVKAVPDDLRLILGIGKTNEKKLHEAGVTTFAQIAAWKDADVKRIGDVINFGERIVKERWVEQAKLLAKGDMDAFYKAFPAAKEDTNT